MPTPVIMPKMEMSQEEARLIEWLVEEGQQIEKGQAIFEVETDKVTVEVESPASGKIAGFSASAGDVVPVTTVVAYILAEGESLSKETTATQHDSSSTPHVSRPTPVAQRLADDLGVDVSGLAGTGPGGRVTRMDVERAARERGAGERESVGVRATPAARRLAREGGVDLAAMAGSGPKGRVQARDVTDWLGDRVIGVPTGVAETQPEVIALAGMRRT
ncbi:MAG: E3 binding domain-containing protein, partial [Caldilineales bacterium]|nr:E3 binding domain-containing protein [Caldilineales bacterium]